MVPYEVAVHKSNLMSSPACLLLLEVRAEVDGTVVEQLVVVGRRFRGRLHVGAPQEEISAAFRSKGPKLIGGELRHVEGAFIWVAVDVREGLGRIVVDLGLHAVRFPVAVARYFPGIQILHVRRAGVGGIFGKARRIIPAMPHPGALRENQVDVCRREI